MLLLLLHLEGEKSKWVPAFAGMTRLCLCYAMLSMPPMYERSTSGTVIEPSAF